ncbi:MarR family winged helix-turn-helix transcriptional regulator [Terrabacter terrigena]|uniref:MarR family winged helix-turn-helix transcriptional regulator n=1 Tax=Terrabacter terrigena TaxID=574718 RepID=A0ABW3N1L5_9MICO
MAVSKDEANDVFLGLLRVQKLLVAARNTAPRLEDGVDATAYPVLFVVAGAGTVRVSDIATTLHNDVSTVSRQVSALVSVGLLEKSADPSDGRASVVSLTERGRDALGRIQASRATWFQGLLSDWESPETAAFVSRLRELGDALDANLRARGAAPPPMPFHTPRQQQDQKQKED